MSQDTTVSSSTAAPPATSTSSAPTATVSYPPTMDQPYSPFYRRVSMSYLVFLILLFIALLCLYYLRLRYWKRHVQREQAEIDQSMVQVVSPYRSSLDGSSRRSSEILELEEQGLDRGEEEVVEPLPLYSAAPGNGTVLNLNGQQVLPPARSEEGERVEVASGAQNGTGTSNTEPSIELSVHLDTHRRLTISDDVPPVRLPGSRATASELETPEQPPPACFPPSA